MATRHASAGFFTTVEALAKSLEVAERLTVGIGCIPEPFHACVRATPVGRLRANATRRLGAACTSFIPSTAALGQRIAVPRWIKIAPCLLDDGTRMNQLRRAFLHECAHQIAEIAAAERGLPFARHGHLWARIMQTLGLPASRFTSSNDPLPGEKES